MNRELLVRIERLKRTVSTKAFVASLFIATAAELYTSAPFKKSMKDLANHPAINEIQTTQINNPIIGLLFGENKQVLMDSPIDTAQLKGKKLQQGLSEPILL